MEMGLVNVPALADAEDSDLTSCGVGGLLGGGLGEGCRCNVDDVERAAAADEAVRGMRFGDLANCEPADINRALAGSPDVAGTAPAATAAAAAAAAAASTGGFGGARGGGGRDAVLL